MQSSVNSAVECGLRYVLTHLHFLLKGTVHLENGSNIFHHSILVKKLGSKNAIHIKKKIYIYTINTGFPGPPKLLSQWIYAL